MPGAILRSGSIVSAWKIKRTSSPRSRRAFATASATRTSRRLPAWMLPETLMPETTTCGPLPSPSATLRAHSGTRVGVRVPVSVMGRSTFVGFRVREGGLAASASGARRGVLARGLDVDDLVRRRAAGRGDGDRLPDAAPEDGLADRRGVRELAAAGIGLVCAHDLERALGPPVHRAQGHARAQVHRARLGPAGVHDLGV